MNANFHARGVQDSGVEVGMGGVHARVTWVADAVVFAPCRAEGGDEARCERHDQGPSFVSSSPVLHSPRLIHPSIHRGLRVPAVYLCESESGCVPGSWHHLQHFLVSRMSNMPELPVEVGTHTASRT